MDEKTYNSFAPERLENYETEAKEIIRELKTDSSFCQRFFYGTDPKKCNMSRLRSKIINDIREIYHVSLSDETFNEIVYLTLWSGGTWKTLDAYNKQSTFFAWLRRVARNAVMVHAGKHRLLILNRCLCQSARRYWSRCKMGIENLRDSILL